AGLECDLLDFRIDRNSTQCDRASRERVWGAAQHGPTGKYAADGIKILFDRCTGHRLDEHHRPIVFQCPTSTFQSTKRVAHIVKAVKKCDQVEPAIRKT